MEEDLQRIGLNKNESKVYLAITELGLSTTTEIAKKSKVHRANVYDAIKTLTDKGLIGAVNKGTTKYYQSTKPTTLLSVIKEKEEIAKALLPRLELLKGLSNQESIVSIQEGLPAAKRAMDSFLEHNDDILVMGVTGNVGELIGPFLANYHKRRRAKKIVMKHIYNTDAHDRIKFLANMSYTEVRILPSEYNAPVATNIVGDEVIMIMWQKNAVVITIKNQGIADAYRRYFNYLWKDAKKPEIKK